MRRTSYGFSAISAISTLSAALGADIDDIDDIDAAINGTGALLPSEFLSARRTLSSSA